MMGASGKQRISPRVWKIAGVASLGPLLTNLDSTVVNVSLAAMGRDLHVQVSSLQWVVTGYLLALALMLPLSGWLVDRVGAKRMYLGCFALFTIASMLCGFSTSAPELIGSRVLQGMAGGLLAPMAQMMVAREAPRHIARVMGLLVVPVLLGPIFGPSLAGFILEHASWHSIFFINLPLGIVAIVSAAYILPNNGRSEHSRSFDMHGFLLLSPALVLLLHSLDRLGKNGQNRNQAIFELVCSLLLLGGFVRHALRARTTALIDMSLFGGGLFRAAAMTQFCANAVSYGGQLLLPLYLLSVLQFTPARVGLLLAWAGVGALVSYPLMGTMTARFGPRRVSAAGAAIAVLGTIPFLAMAPLSLTGVTIGVALFVRGVGLGGITVPSMAAAYGGMSREHIPMATTALNIVQRLGGPVAVTILAIVLNMHRASSAILPTAGSTIAAGVKTSASVSIGPMYQKAFLILSAMHGLTLLAAWHLPLHPTGTGSRHPLPGSSDESANNIADNIQPARS